MITLPDKDSGSSAGFTLLELMIAVAVLAIALVALLSSQSRTMFVADGNDYATTSAHLGSRQLAEILSVDPDTAPSSANFNPPYGDYFWEVEIGAPPLEQNLLSDDVVDYLQRVDLLVGDERRKQRSNITRYRFVPKSL